MAHAGRCIGQQAEESASKSGRVDPREPLPDLEALLGQLEQPALDLVKRVRAGPAPGPVAVAGESARFVDQLSSLGGRLPLALALLAVTTLLILFAMTGSLVLPLKALVMNALGISAAFGLLVLFALALTWIAVGMGMVSPSAEAASNNAMPLIFLPLISSTFVPVDAMPGWFQPIAEYQPFTPAIETLRGLLLGTEIGDNGWITLAWCLALTALGYRWSRTQFDRDPE